MLLAWDGTQGGNFNGETIWKHRFNVYFRMGNAAGLSDPVGSKHTGNELAESGPGDEVIMSIAGHVSRARLSRYSHVRMEAKRRALYEIAARQNA